MAFLHPLRRASGVGGHTCSVGGGPEASGVPEGEIGGGGGFLQQTRGRALGSGGVTPPSSELRVSCAPAAPVRPQPLCNHFAPSLGQLQHSRPPPLEERRGGGGVWDPKVCVPKMARQDCPNGKLRFFRRRSLWSVGGGGGVQGGGLAFPKCPDNAGFWKPTEASLPTSVLLEPPHQIIIQHDHVCCCTSTMQQIVVILGIPILCQTTKFK